MDEQAEIQQRKLLVKKKKKAKFELPHPNVVKSLPRATTSSNPKRLQRRISSDFVPIFDLGDIQGYIFCEKKILFWALFGYLWAVILVLVGKP